MNKKFIAGLVATAAFMILPASAFAWGGGATEVSVSCNQIDATLRAEGSAHWGALITVGSSKAYEVDLGVGSANKVSLGGIYTGTGSVPVTVQFGAFGNVAKDSSGPATTTTFINCVEPKGAEGKPGKDGANGINGKDSIVPGPQGPPGSPSTVPGPAGPLGPGGPAGPKGDSGPPGTNGENGGPGPIGPVGPKGNQGSVGPVGPIGPQGPKGETGVTGLTGKEGARGETGVAGTPGLTGLSTVGAVGSVGPAGLPGIPGVAGKCCPPVKVAKAKHKKYIVKHHPAVTG